MGLNADDKKPIGMSLVDAYENIRRWYSGSIPLLREKMGGRDYAKKSEALIHALPPASQLSELEIRAVLGEVIYGNLEWAYHQTDRNYKIAAYAHAALETAGMSWSINEQEKQKLKASALWPHLMINGE